MMGGDYSGLEGFSGAGSFEIVGGPRKRKQGGEAPSSSSIGGGTSNLVTWNPLDKSAGIALSNGNLIATDTVVGDVAVRATISHAPGSGLYHFEFRVGSTYAGGDTGPGFCTAAAPLGSVGVNATNGVIVYAAGNIYFNGLVTAKAVGALSSGDVIGMELNRATNMFWARRNNDNWFQDAAANPATGVNGLDLSAVFAASAIFPLFAANSSGSFGTANFGATAPAFAASPGFGAW